ncbi:hypothetical protein TRFO_36885 [Tritrichomonas foetus]|uniref:Saposin B-type domain-containing protein n=1 Tax=Tritrichomonas foetus TaxID=1144522 RepID=A0A1J4JHM6_9EUKA|nr:hypothetical protein TRFO_36885 [Tritrichomonas foetus]|eukprot:OHS96989.1 hypothetical protein TRFO_36885 [Tritrichomonas foetus]
MISLLFLLTASLEGNQTFPVTNFLKSNKACAVCKSLTEDIESFINNNVLHDVIQSTLLKKCNSLDGFAQITCTYLVKEKLDDLIENAHYGVKACIKLKLCSKKQIQSNEIPRIPKARIIKPNAKPLKTDCSLCEMLVQYGLEVHLKKGAEPFYNHFQEQCQKIPQFQAKCHLFTLEVLTKIGTHLKEQTSAFEICVYAKQC